MWLFLFLLWLPFNSFGLAENTGLKFSSAVDLTGNFGAKNQTEYPQRFEPREVEFGVYGPIDHTFDGKVFFAAHNVNGDYHLELHEATISSNKLIDGLRLRAGQFFLGVGRLNQFHRHDWPFLSTPKVHETFFDEEGVSDSGVEASSMLKFLPFAADFTIGVTNGWKFGHAHGTSGSKPLQPTHYARLATFFPLGESGGLQWGSNYLGVNSRTDGERRIVGFDLVGKIRDATNLLWLFQMEAYGRTLRPTGGALSRSFGTYIFLQRHLLGDLYLGLRWDGFSVHTSPQSNLDYSWIPTFTYKHSEFAQFRAAYQWDFEKRGSITKSTNRAFQVQATFFLGDHPAHDF
jgi:hypothetical protein